MTPQARREEARGSDPRGSQQGGNPAYVRVVNPCWNGKAIIRRKDAEHYVSEGRAVWLAHNDDGSDQIRLTPHPKNRATSVESAAAYHRAAAVMIRRPEELIHLSVVRPDIALVRRSTR